jgi:hypothetical protein
VSPPAIAPAVAVQAAIAVRPTAASPASAVAASDSGTAMPASPAPSGAGSSNTALGVLGLIAAGGAAVLRLRQLSSAMGAGDAGTLAALAHSATTFWAGSCVAIGGGNATAGPVGASLTTASVEPLSVLGSRAGFGVRGAISGPVDALGGRASRPAATVARAAGQDRTGLVAALCAASAIVGAALGALRTRNERIGAR